jgi:hypothetical protein
MTQWRYLPRSNTWVNPATGARVTDETVARQRQATTHAAYRAKTRRRNRR